MTGEVIQVFCDKDSGRTSSSFLVNKSRRSAPGNFQLARQVLSFLASKNINPLIKMLPSSRKKNLIKLIKTDKKRKKGRILTFCNLLDQTRMLMRLNLESFKWNCSVKWARSNSASTSRIGKGNVATQQIKLIKKNIACVGEGGEMLRLYISSTKLTFMPHPEATR